MMDSPNGQRGHTGGGDLLPPNLVGAGHNSNASWMSGDQNSHAPAAGLIRFNNMGAHSQLFQNQHQNSFLQQLQKVSATSAGTSDWQGSEYQASRGESIPGKMFTYHSISELEDLVTEKQALSLDTESQQAKVFKSHGTSILSLSQEDNDIQLLINQEELVKNLLAPFKSHNSSNLPSSLPALTDPILDFTLCSRNRLYLLYPKLLAVLDLSNLLAPRSYHSPSKTVFDTQPDFLDWVALPSAPSYNALKSVNINGSLHLLLYNTKTSSLITHLTINDGTSDQQVLVSDVFESDQVQHYRLKEGETKTIQDVQICGGEYACVLMDRNEVQVIDLKLKQIVFRAQYKDTTAKIVKIYYIGQSVRYFDTKNRNETPFSSDQEGQEDKDEDRDRFKDDEIVGEDDEDQEVQQFIRQGQRRLPLFRNATVKDLSPNRDEASQKPFAGFFLLIENVATKDPITQKSHNYFEKLSIAKILNKPTGNAQKPYDQRLQQIDYLKISEKSRKLVEFDQRRGIVFLMNNKIVTNSTPNSQPCLKLYAIQLKQFYTEEGVNNSDSDNEDRIRSSPTQIDGNAPEASGLKFSFIKGMHLQMGSQVVHNIATSQTSSAKRPKFFKIMTKKNKSLESDQPLTYYFYTSIGGQIITHSLNYPVDLQQSDIPKHQPIQHTLPFQLHPHSTPNLFQPNQQYQAMDLQADHQSIFGLDPFFTLTTTHPLESDPHSSVGAGEGRASLLPTMSFGDQQQQSQEFLFLPQEVCNALYLLEDDDLQEEVTREMQEAIEKDMESINGAAVPTVAGVQEDLIAQIMAAEEEEPLLIDSGIKIEEEEKKSANEEDAQAIEKPAAAKEIHLSADQFNLIQAAKQGSVSVQNAAEKKKKKKAAKKAAAVAQGTAIPTPSTVNEEVKVQKSSPIQSTRPLPSQSSILSANTLPFMLISAPQPQAQTMATYQPKAIATTQAVNVQKPAQNQLPSAQVAPQTKNKNNGAASAKPLDDTILENFSELTKKYQDLSQKFQKLQDQLNNQSQQQAELDRCIAKNIGQVVPSVIELQLKDKIVPLVLGHMKAIDRNIRDEVMPQVQSQIQDIITKLIRQNKIQILSQKQEEEIKKRGISIDESIQNEIKAMVIEEFAKAMEQGIKPMLQDQFAGIVTEVKANLKFLNQQIAQNIAEEQQKNSEIIRQLNERIDSIQNQNHGSTQMYQINPQPQYPPYTQYPPYGGYHYAPYYPHPPPPPPFYPPYYHPHPQMHGSNMSNVGYQGLAPQHQSEQKSNDLNFTPTQSIGQPGSHINMQQPPITYSQSNYSPLVIPPPISSNQYQSQFNHAQPHHQQAVLAAQTVKQTTPSFSDNDPHHHQLPPQLKHSATQICLTNQDTMMLMFNEEAENPAGAITPLSAVQARGGSQSNMEEIKQSYHPQQQVFVRAGFGSKIKKERSISSYGSNPSAEEVKESPNKKKGKQPQNAAQKAQLDQLINSGDTQVPVPIKKWQILPYMKDVATQGKSSSADFLLCGSQEFLEETVQFVSQNSHIITNQYSYKIIHQFIKKVYNRAKENEKARKGAAIILGIFIEKIYKVRDNMKQLVCQATAMENEIKALIEDD